jgi:hypothetical protein
MNEEAIKYRFLYYKTQAAFDSDLENEKITDDSIVFIEDSKKIWTHGTYFSGGGGGSTPVAEPIDISSTPIRYYKTSNKSEVLDINRFSNIDRLSSSRTTAIELRNQFLYLLVPNNIRLVRAVTSRFEDLDLTTNIVPDTTTVTGATLWKYLPDVAPQNLTITFTFTIS